MQLWGSLIGTCRPGSARQGGNTCVSSIEKLHRAESEPSIVTGLGAISPEISASLRWPLHRLRTNSTAHSRSLWSVGFILAAVVAVAFSSALLTPFRSPGDVLAERTWGIGRTPTSVMTGIARGRPWWHRHMPSGFVRGADGTAQPVVRLAPSDIVELDVVVTVPYRSIGYDAILGGVIALRSFGTSDLVYDWWSIIRFQQAALVVALLCPLLAVVSLARPRNRALVAAAFAVAFAFLLLQRPFENAWLIDGIIDSALAAPAALLAVPLIACVAGLSTMRLRRAVWMSASCGLALGLLTMIRGELAIVFLIGLGIVALWECRLRSPVDAADEVTLPPSFRSRLRPLAPVVACIACLLSVPTAYGLMNVAIHGHFVPFRLQSGQNLVEPVGEFPNPWGIEYSDEWMIEYLRSKEIDYISFEADSVLTRQYFGMVAQEPMLFIRNAVARLDRLPDSLAFDWIGPVSLPVLLLFAILLGRRFPRSRAALVPLVLALGLVAFHAWFGSPGRALAPVRFLMVAAVCAGIATLAGGMADAWRRRIPWRRLRDVGAW